MFQSSERHQANVILLAKDLHVALTSDIIIKVLKYDNICHYWKVKVIYHESDGKLIRKKDSLCPEVKVMMILV